MLWSLPSVTDTHALIDVHCIEMYHLHPQHLYLHVLEGYLAADTLSMDQCLHIPIPKLGEDLSLLFMLFIFQSTNVDG
jgi:hypothetical protein